MKVIIVGAGEVGFQIAKALSYENIDVVVIDRDKEKIKRVMDELDVAVIVGEGGDISSLEEAGAESADILLAVTNSDETNMIACMLAKAMFKVPRKIARIRNVDYFKNEKLLNAENLDINPAINPEFEAAMSIIRLLEIPVAIDVEDFEGGMVKVIGLKLQESNLLIGKSLKEIGRNIEKKFLIGMIERDDETIIPTGYDRIYAGDIIYVPVKREEVNDVFYRLGIDTTPVKRIMILGGGRVGSFIASHLETKIDIKIIEQNEERCKLLSRNLKRALVLHGDGADQALLSEENVFDMDFFVAVSNNDELNIMASLLAKKEGAKKVIAIVNRTDYIYLARSLGVDVVLSPRLLTASTILRYVRKGDILSLTSIADGKAEIIEARVGESSNLINKSLMEAKIPKFSLIGTIIRGNQVIIPQGSDKIYKDDRLIIFALRQSIKNVEKVLM
ncbi:MAG: Trk system potassium transporter TrkA [Thermodesulfovibrionales bacterium]|nr:Trk system potassium transporter TrkA [Thermodesulfovibrionales bacterium]